MIELFQVKRISFSCKSDVSYYPSSGFFFSLSGKLGPFDIIFTLLKHCSNKTNWDKLYTCKVLTHLLSPVQDCFAILIYVSSIGFLETLLVIYIHCIFCFLYTCIENSLTLIRAS